VQDRQRRQAANEALMREVNERVATLDRHAGSYWADDDQLFEFVCECGTSSCEEQVRMTLAEYEQVRTQDDRFAVVPGHETTEIERTVVATERFRIVDKVDAAEKYVADDPRGASSGGAAEV
jgi:hypothetical protein